ncbi:twin-arginine translocation signal domain-containing protein [Neptunomonas antarctica]|uniref:Formate dehydrogenase region TAT target n=1 Tax=Neptunomonas antarctica TaxID=619304 RepID=A0A1N7NCN4_9GAMM|nr:twin-arginine translocation signal domain-containing protein [Neptunomonas antarctica]SIS96114.1 formate dehydrogenase region TAT target [Neptunomonas antarctica]
MSQQEKPNTERRGFLKTLGLAGTALGAAAVVGTVEAQASTPETDEKKQSAGYQETEHVRSFYNTLRN